MAVSDFQSRPDETHPGAAPFLSTHWTTVLSAANKHDSGLARQSLEKLCRASWHPLYFFARRQGSSPHDAQDLAQGFFALLLEKDFLDSVDRGKGRFRSFLLAAFKHFCSNEHDKLQAQKRGGGQIPISIDVQSGETQYAFEPADKLTPEKIFERRWAMTLLERATMRLREEYVSDGKAALFEQIKVTLTEPRGTIGYAALGEKVGLSEGAVKVAVHRLRQRFRAVFREEIADTVVDPGQIEDEVRHAFMALSG